MAIGITAEEPQTQWTTAQITVRLVTKPQASELKESPSENQQASFSQVLKTFRVRLTTNLNILQEQAAAYDRSAPENLLDQIAAYKAALQLVQQADPQQMSAAELQSQLASFNLGIEY